MSVFEVKECKTREIPENCREVIKEYAKKGMFGLNEVFGGREYTTFYFLMTQDCNGKCPYCYQPKEFRRTDKIMTKEVIDDSMDFIFTNFKENRVKFSLFGGEPLMNFEMVKYIVESYPMIKSVLTTNGILIKEDKIIRKWIKKQKNNLNLSVSINALKYVYPNEDFKSLVQPCIDTVKGCGGDFHYVVEDPDDPKVFDEIRYLFDQNVPVIRISPARHWDVVKNKNESFVKLFKKLADFIYFTGPPKFGRTNWDIAFNNNIYRKHKGVELSPTPPTFCGCGYLYLAINCDGEIYPCDFFANYEEFKLGDVYKGFNETAHFFEGMSKWIDGLYEGCKECPAVPSKDIKLCPRAMCLAENYTVSGKPLEPAPNHCLTNKIEYQLMDYIASKGIELGIDNIYYQGRKK